MRRAETTVAALFVLAAVVMLREALRRPVGWTASGPGTGFFPFWLVTGIGIIAVALVVQSLRTRDEGDEPFIPAGAWRPLLIVFLPMVAVVALLDILGIYIGGALYLAGYMRLVGRHRWGITILVSVLIPLALFFVFERWFLMLLPKGQILESILYGRAR